MKLFSSKKGYTIADLPTLAIYFGLGVIVLSIVAEIVSDVRDTQTANTYEYNVSTKGMSGLLKIGNWLPTVGLVVGAVIVIGALFMFYRFKK